MHMQELRAPTPTLEAQVQWLIDRASISDLLFHFARALDSKDFEAYTALYASDGVLELPDPRSGSYFTLRQAELAEALPRSLGRYTATHHLSCNHQIEISGDRATSRSYLQAVHVGSEPRQHWSAGGWYDCEYRREQGNWRFTRVRLTAVWLDGEPGEIRPEP
jgi:SnoaL-like domain